MTWRLVRVTGGRPGPARKWWTLSVLATVLLLGVSAWIVYGTGAFAVDRIVVRGTTFIDDDEIRDAAAVSKGTSLASIDADEIARRVAKLPPVKRVNVSRDWPHTIVIDVTEREPFLSVPEGEKFTLVDDFGVAFRTVSDAADETVVAVLENPGRSDPATIAVVTVVSALTPELMNVLVKVDGTAANRISLELESDRVVIWGDASDSDRKAEVATALLNRSEQHLDVSAPDVPTVS